MQKFKTLATSRLAVFVGGAVLALLLAWPFVGRPNELPVEEPEVVK